MRESRVAASLQPWGKVIAARVYRAANQVIPTGSATPVNWTHQVEASAGMHSTTVNNTRITLPVAGYWRITFHGVFAAHSTGGRSTRVHLNGSTEIARSTALPPASPSLGAMPAVHIERSFAAGDYIEVLVTQDSGGDLALLALTAYSPYLTVVRS